MTRATCLLTLCLVSANCAAPLTPAAREARSLGDVQQLTRDFADATDPAISPDGRWLAFRAVPRDEETPQLFVARTLYDGNDLAGLGVPIRVTPPGSRSSSPAFSPDGRSLVFASTARGDGEPLRPTSALLDFDRYADLFRVDAWQRNVAAADPRAGVNLARRKLAAAPGYDAEAVFDPSGRLIVFASGRGAEAGGVKLYAMRPDGSGVTPLTDGPGRDESPAIGPGGRVVFQSDRAAAGRFDLYELTLNFSGDRVTASPPRRLTRDAGATQPTFAGNAILYSGDADDRRGVGNRELHWLDPATGRDVRLTFDPAADESSRLAPDGHSLLFASRRTIDGSRQLFVARLDRP